MEKTAGWERLEQIIVKCQYVGLCESGTSYVLNVNGS